MWPFSEISYKSSISCIPVLRILIVCLSKNISPKIYAFIPDLVINNLTRSQKIEQSTRNSKFVSMSHQYWWIVCVFFLSDEKWKKKLMNPKQRAVFSLLKNMALFFLVNSFQRWSFDKVSDCKYIEKAWYKSHIHHPDVIGIIYSMTV